MTFTLTYWRPYFRQGTFYDSAKGLYIDRYYPYGSEAFSVWPPPLDTSYSDLPVARLTAPPGWTDPPLETPPPLQPPNTDGGNSIRIAAGATINGGRVIALRPGGAFMADRLIDSYSIVGISKGSALVGELAEIATRGETSDSGWNWVIGEPVFLGAAPGELVQGSTQVVVVQIGTAIGQSKIWVRPEPPIKLI